MHTTGSVRARRRTIGGRIAVLIAVLALAAAACGNSGDDNAGGGTSTTSASGGGSTTTIDTATKAAISGVPGVTDTQIRYAAVGTDKGNPLGTCMLPCFVDGVNAYFAWRNSEGGIYGRKLEVTTTLDDEVANNQPKSLEIVSANDTFGTFSAPLAATGWADLAKAGIPTYTLAINPNDGQPQIFGNVAPICFTCTSRPTAWVLKEAGAKKVAAVGYGVTENSKQCAESNRSTVEKYSAEIGGAKLVYFKDDLAFGLSNGVGPEVTEMKKKGVDFILSCLDVNGMKTLAAELQRQGIRDKVTMFHPNSYSQEALQAANGLFDGDSVRSLFRPFEADPGKSQMNQYHEWMKKTGKKESEHSVSGWINADLAYQGLVAAGPQFDRQKVVDATNTLTAFTAGGLIQPIDWTRQHLPPTEDDPKTHGPKYECLSGVEVDTSGKFVLLGDPKKPFLCWPGQTRAWSTPKAMDFG